VTEAEWNACTDPTPMLESLRGKASDRKIRLFCVACCRRTWHMLTDPRSRKAVEVAELLVDGLLTEKQLRKAERGANAAETEAGANGKSSAYYAALIARNTVVSFPDPLHASRYAVAALAAVDENDRTGNQRGTEAEAGDHKRRQEQAMQCDLLREIIGPALFRPVRLDPTWLTSTVRHLAEAIYEERAFDRLPILADALEDAGCTSHDVLDHCRQPGEHVRGCWALDLALGKE